MERRKFIHSLTMGGVLTASGLITSCETTTANDNNTSDLQIVQDAANFEAMGIQTYAAAANSGLLTDPAVINTALAFMADHEKHLEELNNLLTTTFSEAAIDPALAAPDPGVGSVANQTDVIRLALSVEFTAATFYFSGIINEVERNDVRRVFANILPIETAHTVTYKTVLGLSPVIDGGIFEDMTSGL